MCSGRQYSWEFIIQLFQQNNILRDTLKSGIELAAQLFFIHRCVHFHGNL
jgi:hypothetical protein